MRMKLVEYTFRILSSLFKRWQLRRCMRYMRPKTTLNEYTPIDIKMVKGKLDRMRKVYSVVPSMLHWGIEEYRHQFTSFYVLFLRIISTNFILISDTLLQSYTQQPSKAFLNFYFWYLGVHLIFTMTAKSLNFRLSHLFEKFLQWHHFFMWLVA